VIAGAVIDRRSCAAGNSSEVLTGFAFFDAASFSTNRETSAPVKVEFSFRFAMGLRGRAMLHVVQALARAVNSNPRRYPSTYCQHCQAMHPKPRDRFRERFGIAQSEVLGCGTQPMLLCVFPHDFSLFVGEFIGRGSWIHVLEDTTFCR